MQVGLLRNRISNIYHIQEDTDTGYLNLKSPISRISASRGGEADECRLQHGLQPWPGRGQRGSGHQHGQVCGHQARPRQH